LFFYLEALEVASEDEPFIKVASVRTVEYPDGQQVALDRRLPEISSLYHCCAGAGPSPVLGCVGGQE
jgi:hypothetical protein